MNKPKVAVVGGGAAGFFLSICLKERLPEAEVTIFERSQKVLAKVAVSGGGRCNCTNSFDDVRDLSQVYPRGHRLLLHTAIFVLEPASLEISLISTMPTRGLSGTALN